jgi:branched-subunit amino acid aminotransferase/4-amino-4-deoxychorismate lyase
MTKPGIKKGITPQRAIELLKKKGVEVDEKKAKEILDLMYFLSKFIVNQIVK